MSLSQIGPFNHTSEEASSCIVRPLDGKSARLSFPEQCAQFSEGISRRISDTLLCLNGFQCLSSPKIQYKATVESVYQQKEDTCKFSLMALAILWMSWANTTTERSSSHGTVCCLRGETRVLDATKSTWIPDLL